LADTRKKVVVTLAVLLTSAALVSLILAISRYVGFLSHPEAWRYALVYRVEPVGQVAAGLRVRAVSLGDGAEGVSSLLASAFWIFEVTVENVSGGPVDVDFDRVTLGFGGREERALTAEAALGLFNERMTGAFASASARREYQRVLDLLQNRVLGVTRVFPGYSRASLVLFQPHPDPPAAAELKLYGIRAAGGDPAPPVAFHLSRETG